jgi:two-component system, chemotaxis family, chemotaxis protein CheY
MASTTTTTLIVDDEADMRALIRAVIDLANEGLEVVGEAADGVEAVERWHGLNPPPVPHVVVMDQRMPRLDGLGATRRILTEQPGQVVILFSAYLNADMRREAAEAGVAACLDKREIDALPDLIREFAPAQS